MKSIKTYISICATALAAIVLSSCVENSSKYKQLQAQLDSLQGTHGTQKNMLDEVFATLNEVEEGLVDIRQKENIITAETNKDGLDVPESQRVRLMEDVIAVKEAINRYKEKIEQLKKDSNLKSVEFKKKLNSLQKELEQAFAILLSERALEPIVQQDAGVPPDNGFVLHHGFFPQSWKKEPYPQNIKRLRSKRAFQCAGRPILKVHLGRPKGHFTHNSVIFA